MGIQQLARPIDFYLELGRDAIRESKAKRTREAYAHDWKMFRLWCERHNEIPLPASPTTIVAYLGAMAEGGKKTSSMARYLVSIGTAHKAANLDSPTTHLAVRSAMQGYKRLLGTAKTKKTAMRKTDLVRIFAAMDVDGDHALNVRDRAVLLLGFSGAFRRSELAALRVENVRFTDEGMVVHLVRSKTDQFAQGRDVGILRGGPLCPVKAVQRWLTVAQLCEGLLFRRVHWRGAIDAQGLTGEAISLIVKRRMREIGRDAKEFGGHSLRRGFCTAAARAGATELQIMRVSGHKSSAMVQEYIEEAGLFDNNATGMLGL